MLMIILGSIIIFFVPSCPTLAVTFSIAETTSYPPKPALSVVTWSYAKVSLSSSSGVTKGQVLLSFAGTVTQGAYTLTIGVDYGGAVVTQPTSFGSVGQGTYQARVAYWPRQENTNMPYVVTITVTQSGAEPATLIVSILPT